MRNRQRDLSLGLIFLASQVFQIGLDNIPPVTLATLGLNVYLFLFPVKRLFETCLSVQEAYWYGDWHRLVYSPFHHVDDWHLYFNMASFLWKGIKLERRLGPAWFAYLLSVFSLLTGLVYLLIEVLLSKLTEDSSYSVQCAVGFSGVLFGLKVVNNYYHQGGITYILELPVANRYACWVELVLIHYMNPGTSFVGHLSGILVGLLYTTGPLRTLMKMSAGLITSLSPSSRSRTYFSSSGYSGYRMPSPPPNNSAYRNTTWASAPPVHPYTGSLSEQEQYEAAVRASLRDQGRPGQTRPRYGFRPEHTAEEVRRRRLERLDK